ncbi:MAG: ABC transporter permease [Balneolaceae bacterium]
MFKSYFRIALRSFRKQPVYTIINLSGLAIGITCCILIGLYVSDELRFDSHHQHSERIYRISQNLTFEGATDKSATTPFPLMEALKQEFPAIVEEGVRFFDMNSPSVAIGNEETDEFIRQENFFFTDPAVFRIFDIPLLIGNPGTALSEPNTVVISTRAARQYFDNENPVGKELVYEGRLRLAITGVMEEWPETSHFKADFLVSFISLENIWQNYTQLTERWRWNPVWTYILLEEGADPKNIEGQLASFTDRYYYDYFGENEIIDLNLQPLTDIRLYSDLENEIEQTSSYIYIYLFSTIALLILSIACINYVNLATVQALNRSKEVGLRKTLGAFTGQLKRQFLLESCLYTTAAVLISTGLVFYLLPFFNRFTGKELSFAQFDTGLTIAGFLVFTVSVSLLAGFYPSVVMSSYNPVDSLRGTFTSGKRGGQLRRTLVVLQFTITASLLVGTALAYFQYQHLQEKDMGFNRENVVVIPASMSLAIWYFDDLKDRMLTHSSVQSVSGSKTIIGSPDSFKYQITPEGYGEEEAHSLTKLFIEQDFFETMQIPLLAGRTFSNEFSTDRDQAVLVNKSMTDYLDWGTPEEALGRTFRTAGKTVTVIGVTDNFHHTYLRSELEPLIMELPQDQSQMVANIEYINVKLAGGNTADAITHMQAVWDDIDKAHPFEYYFLDDKLEEIYESEQQLMELLSLFTFLAIIIGCLGLLGLSSYSVVSRTREIGIRKALGSTTTGIFFLLSKDYLKLVLLAHLISFPVVYYLSAGWLQSFPYQIDFAKHLAFTFFMSIIISISITLFTISSQSLKVALTEPVKCLKRD